MGVFSTARELHVNAVNKADLSEEAKKNNNLEEEQEPKNSSKNDKSESVTPKRKTARKSTK